MLMMDPPHPFFPQRPDAHRPRVRASPLPVRAEAKLEVAKNEAKEVDADAEAEKQAAVQLAALRDAHGHLDRRDGDQGAVAADRLDTALNHVISTWRVRTTRSSVWPFCPTRMPACSHAPCCHQGSRMTERVSTRFIIMIHAQHH